MRIEIDFNELLRRSVNSAVDATTKMTDKHPEFSSKGEQLQIIASISAQTTIQILREYHAMLEKSLGTDGTIH